MSLIYLIGPMTGYAGENRQAFRSAAKVLEAQGHSVLTPDTLDSMAPAKSKTWQEYLRRSLPWISQAELGVALPGWVTSRGCVLEVILMSTFGIPVVSFMGDRLEPIPSWMIPEVSLPSGVSSNR